MSPNSRFNRWTVVIYLVMFLHKENLRISLQQKYNIVFSLLAVTYIYSCLGIDEWNEGFRLLFPNGNQDINKGTVVSILIFHILCAKNLNEGEGLVWLKKKHEFKKPVWPWKLIVVLSTLFKSSPVMQRRKFRAVYIIYVCTTAYLLPAWSKAFFKDLLLGGPHD